ncbi:MAG: A/G-specific adenine glycosylase [Flavipsychrobacter sp.]
MKLTAQKTKYFTEQLMHWHEYENDRSLPWKEERNPYKVWLSEIILQQTRAEQGLPYFLRFTEQYPTIGSLAAAKDDDVFKLWQGLGYYNRCKNMLVAARYITAELGGVFPNTYEELLQLKGVGAYTAAAISSFAFGLPQAVVDGNVYRVLSRFWAIDTPIDTTEGKKLFTNLAEQLLDKKNSAKYNQAIMDFGATVCTPKLPNCALCPLAGKCAAQKQSMIHLLPIKSKKVKVKNRFFHYVIFHHQDDIWITKRGTGDIWENLYEPYLIEGAKILDEKEVVAALNKGKIKVGDLVYEGTLKQRLTHQLIQFQFYTCRVAKKENIEDGVWVKKEELKAYSFPKTLVSFFEKKLYF